MESGGFFPFGGDPEDLLRGLREFAEQQTEGVKEAQREQFATLTLSTAVELTAAALKQVQPTGSAEEQAGALRDAAFLRLASDQMLRRVAITGRPDLGMPNFREHTGRAAGFAPLTSQDITNVVALLAGWREEP